MSLAMIAKMFGVELPDELLAQLPDLAAKIPVIVADAEKLVTTATQRVANLESTLSRIETKLNALGAAFIASQEKQNVIDTDADPGTASDGSNSGNAAATAAIVRTV